MLPRALRALYTVWFIVHIPITVLIDGQAVLGQFYPEVSVIPIARCNETPTHGSFVLVVSSRVLVPPLTLRR